MEPNLEHTDRDMADDLAPTFEFHPLKLSDAAARTIVEEELRRHKAWHDQRERKGGAAFYPTPFDDDYVDPSILAAQKARERAEKVHSTIGLPSNAWAFDLRRLSSDSDAMICALLKEHELFLCRVPVAIVEADGETIKDVRLTLTHGVGVNYKLWPTQTYVSSGKLSASFGGTVKLGLTSSLELLPADAVGSSQLLWQGEWRWARASVKASGEGRSEAVWELKRRRDEPFAGDSGFIVVLLTAKGIVPGSVGASLAATLSPAGVLGRFFDYTVGELLPLNIPYIRA